MEKTKTALFLPNYFKKIGLIAIIFSFLFLIIIKLFFNDYLQSLFESQKSIYKVSSFNLLLLGLFFIGWSRDKFEDEMSIILRMQAMVWTLTFTIITVIFQPFFDLLFGESIEVFVKGFTAQRIMFQLLIGQILIHYLQKLVFKWKAQ